MIVDGDVHDELLGRLAERADDLRVGPGIDPASDLGPLVSVESRWRVACAVAAASTDGARIVTGGHVPEELPAQAGYYRPTVVTGLKPTHALIRDELFGPVTAVLRAGDEDDALRLANATEYGLAASIFTRDIGRALRFSRALQAGVVFVNAATVEAETPSSLRWHRRQRQRLPRHRPRCAGHLHRMEDDVPGPGRHRARARRF